MHIGERQEKSGEGIPYHYHIKVKVGVLWRLSHPVEIRRVNIGGESAHIGLVPSAVFPVLSMCTGFANKTVTAILEHQTYSRPTRLSDVQEGPRGVGR